MEILSSFKIGSCAFFSEFEDFKPNGLDILVFVDELPSNTLYQHIMEYKKNYFIYKKMEKNDFFDVISSKHITLFLHCLLVPECAEYIGVTIEDLKQFKDVIKNTNRKYKYLGMIYDYYIENEKFQLTKEQLINAYNTYKQRKTPTNEYTLNNIEKTIIIKACENINNPLA